MIRFLKPAFMAATLAATSSATLAGDGLGLSHGITVDLQTKQIGTQIDQRHKDHLRDALTSACVDLAVFARKQSLGGDRVRITYGVTNVSRVNYVSGAHQQAISLGKNGSNFAAGRFASLNAGQSRSWTVDVGTPFEFPDTYKAIFNHDPDLYIDGNTANDDCNGRNNERQVVVSHSD